MQFEQVPHFVGLQVSDKMPVDVIGQERYLRLQFLHAAFPEMAFSRFIGFADSFYGLVFGDAHERDMRGYMCAYLMDIVSNLHFSIQHSESHLI